MNNLGVSITIIDSCLNNTLNEKSVNLVKNDYDRYRNENINSFPRIVINKTKYKVQ